MNKVPELPAGVMIFIFFEDTIHLIHRDKKEEIMSPNTWCSVTGGVKKNETYSQAIARELKDETGLVLDNIATIGESRFRNCFFFVRITREEKEKVILGEGQDFKFLTIDEIPVEISGAFKKYYEKYPNVFKRMFSDESFIPSASDLGLDSGDISQPASL